MKKMMLTDSPILKENLCDSNSLIIGECNPTFVSGFILDDGINTEYKYQLNLYSKQWSDCFYYSTIGIFFNRSVSVELYYAMLYSNGLLEYANYTVSHLNEEKYDTVGVPICLSGDDKIMSYVKNVFGALKQIPETGIIRATMHFNNASTDYIIQFANKIIRKSN